VSEEAGDAAQALDRLSDPNLSSFDAVIIGLEPAGEDLSSAGSPPLDASLRQDPRFANLPLVLITPLHRSVRRSDWEHHGYMGRVTKPIKQGEFGACLAAALGLDKIAAAPVRKAALFIPGKLEGRARHRFLVVEDNLVNQEVVIGMLEWTSHLPGK
jgi:hypothetical protein